MKSLTDDARRRTSALVLAMSPAARLELAFSLGEEDLALFMRVHALDRPSALCRLRQVRHHGRAPSVAAAAGPACASST